jgi:hypothetical protein
VHVSTSDLIKKTNKNYILSFKNFVKILHTANDVSHKRAKYQFQILYILNNTKIIKV